MNLKSKTSVSASDRSSVLAKKKSKISLILPFRGGGGSSLIIEIGRCARSTRMTPDDQLRPRRHRRGDDDDDDDDDGDGGADCRRRRSSAASSLAVSVAVSIAAAVVVVVFVVWVAAPISSSARGTSAVVRVDFFRGDPPLPLERDGSSLHGGRRSSRGLVEDGGGDDDDDDIVPPPPPSPGGDVGVVVRTKTKGIVYSKDAGSRESRPLPSPVGGPPGEVAPEKETTTMTTKEKDDAGGEEGEEEGEEEDGGPPADTIFDDLLRGFAFAASFSAFIVALHCVCRRACVRCGLLVDDRVLEARMRRMRLRKKRSYRRRVATAADAPGGDRDGDDDDDDDDATMDDLPPLDTRKWGEWMATRDGAGAASARDCEFGGVWNSDVDDGSVAAWDDDDDGYVGGGHVGESLVEFGLEMSELEYGEGDELEDMPHDSRLFDEEDGGAGAEREAERFFGGGGRAVGVGGATNGGRTGGNGKQENEGASDGEREGGGETEQEREEEL